ncbi:MAG: hypothetical protein ACI8S6_005286, partial [Myxococcota bacterium]
MALGLPLLLAAVLRQSALSSLDLRDMPGPGGVKMIAELARGNTGRDWCTWLIASAQPLVDGDILAASWLVMTAGGLGSVLAASLAAAALAGWRAGLAAGLLAACWSPLVLTAVIIGADSPSCGLTWLGLAACWAGARSGWRGLPLVALGAGLALFGALVKIVTLPALAFAAVTPLLAPRDRPAYAIFLATVLGGVLLWGGLSLGGQSSMIEGVPALSVEGLQQGGEKLTTLLGPRLTSSLITQMALLGLLGALWPGRHRLVRGILVALAVFVFAFTAQTVSDKLRVRYLIPASFPSVVLAGVALGGLAGTLRRLGPLAWAPTLAVCLGLGFDSLAYLGSWSNLRGRYQSSLPHTLPSPPFAYLGRYDDLPLLHLTDHGAIGAVDLVELTLAAPPAGAATIPLRDAREFHLSAAAGAHEIPYAILEPQKCCPQNTSKESCALQIIDQIDAVGARLILPTHTGSDNRIPVQQLQWKNLLLAAARSRHAGSDLGWWWLW